MIQHGPVPVFPTDGPEVSPLHAPPALQPMPVEFQGTAREFFGIWIVNLLLTVVTLGIWSAWAKVRTKRWFLGNTSIDGHAFDYHASPLQILQGRIIAFIVIGVMSAISYFAPSLFPVLWLIWMMAMPAAINAGLRFNAHMTSWRNVRFEFQGSYGRALVLFMLMPILVMLSLGLLAPFYSKMLGKYLFEGYRFGGARFTTQPKVSTMYGGLIRSAVLFFVALMPGLLAIVLWGPEGLPLAAMDIYVALFIASVHYGVYVRNELLTQTAIDGGHRLQSQVDPAVYTWIVASGLVATAASLTLAYPWARVRQHRYLMKCTTLHAASGLENFVSEQRASPDSFGGELSEFEGFGSVASL